MKSKEEILKGFRSEFSEYLRPKTIGVFDSILLANEFEEYLTKAINQTREETIREIRKHDEEELIKIVDKLKLDVETRIAFKNLKPESVGYNKCALKVQIKIKQIKQLIKDYYAK